MFYNVCYYQTCCKKELKIFKTTFNFHYGWSYFRSYQQEEYFLKFKRYNDKAYKRLKWERKNFCMQISDSFNYVVDVLSWRDCLKFLAFLMRIPNKCLSLLLQIALIVLHRHWPYVNSRLHPGSNALFWMDLGN